MKTIKGISWREILTYTSVGVAVVVAAVLVFYIWLGNKLGPPAESVVTSPNGQTTVIVQTDEVADGTGFKVIMSLRTNKDNQTHKTSISNWTVEGPYTENIFWAADSKRFAWFYWEGSPPTLIIRSYMVQAAPLFAQYTADNTWIKKELQNQKDTAKAKEFLQLLESKENRVHPENWTGS